MRWDPVTAHQQTASRHWECERRTSRKLKVGQQQTMLWRRVVSPKVDYGSSLGLGDEKSQSLGPIEVASRLL